MNSANDNKIFPNKEGNPQFIFLEKIKAMLITILEKEQINNFYKISLSNLPFLNLQKYFIEIDTNKKSFITINDLKNYFNLHSLSYSDQILRKFIHLFDKHNKFYLIYDDFSKIFLPYDSRCNYNNYFLTDEKDLIMIILKGYLELIEQINEMVIDIRKTNNFTTYEAFMGISKGNKYLDEEFLIHFLEHNYNENEVNNLIYLIDKNNDKLISYDEFQDFLIPLLEYNNNLISNDDYNDNENEIEVENNDIVNYKKSGKNKKNLNKDFNNEKDIDNNFENQNKNEENNIDNNKEDLEKEYNPNIISNENNYDNSEGNNNLSQEYNKEEENIEESNNQNIKNNYGNIISSEDEYDNYCNFYRKTKQVLIPSKYNQINIKHNLKENNNLNIVHSEIQYLPKIKNNFNTAEKENNSTNNINNFTVGKQTEKDISNASSKKINLNINSNDLENYSLSNEYNNLNNNMNIISNETNNKNITSVDNILPNKENNNNININISEENNKILNSDKEIISSKNKEEYTNINIKINTSLSSFIKYIQYLLSKEKKTMDLKDQLSLREDILLKDLFCIFDYNKRNLISKKEFKVVCKKIFGLYPTFDQVELVFKRYDRDKDSNLNLKEFLDMIKPLKEEYAYYLFNKNKKGEKNNNSRNIIIKSKKIFNDVIRSIIENEGYYYKYKDDLDNNNLFNLKEFWNVFVEYSNNEKGIDKIEMNKFLEDNGCSLSQYDIDIIFNKIDYDKDDIISYEDLIQEFENYY